MIYDWHHEGWLLLDFHCSVGLEIVSQWIVYILFCSSKYFLSTFCYFFKFELDSTNTWLFLAHFHSHVITFILQYELSVHSFFIDLFIFCLLKGLLVYLLTNYSLVYRHMTYEPMISLILDYLLFVWSLIQDSFFIMMVRWSIVNEKYKSAREHLQR